MYILLRLCPSTFWIEFFDLGRYWNLLVVSSISKFWGSGRGGFAKASWEIGGRGEDDDEIESAKHEKEQPWSVVTLLREGGRDNELMDTGGKTRWRGCSGLGRGEEDSGRFGAGEDVKLEGPFSSWGDCALIGIIGRDTLLETRESFRKLGSNLGHPLPGESGQWGWQRKESTEGEDSDLQQIKEGEGEGGGELLEHDEGGGGGGAGRWVAILSNLPILSSGGLST